MSTLSEKDRTELSLLLPWHANGTLDSDDTRRVEAALAQDPALAREFDLILEDQAALIELVSEEEVPASMGERFKAALNAAPGPATAEPPRDIRDTGERLISRMLSVLFPARPRAYAFATALVVALLPVVALVSYQAGHQQSGQYKTATGAQQTKADTMRVLVKFNTAAALADIDSYLRAQRGQVVKGPTADGLYELEFEKADGLVDRMGSETDVFEFVLPVN